MRKKNVGLERNFSVNNHHFLFLHGETPFLQWRQ